MSFQSHNLTMKTAPLVIMIRRLLLIATVTFCPQYVNAGNPMNIVFILADNQSAAALPIYGNRDSITPHIDQLAARGTYFSRAFAASGMCSPTRATLLTGLMPSQHGLHNALHDDWVDKLKPGWSALQSFQTVPSILQSHGYETAMIGKWHLGDARTPQIGFRHWVALPYGHTIDFWQNHLIENGTLIDVSGRHIVDVLAEKAVSYLQQVSDKKPFYLQLNLDGPYALPPTNYGPAKNRYYEKFAQMDFKSMPVEPLDDNLLRRLNGPFNPEHAIENGIDSMAAGEIWNSILYRTIRMQGDKSSYANFLSQNAIVDDAVGKVWAALKARNLEKNTIIVYSSDQGNHFGQNGTWGHTIWFWPSHLHEVAMNIPLIVYHPGFQTPGSRSDVLIGQYDIASTLLEYAGINSVKLNNSPGQSFAHIELENGTNNLARQAVFFEQEESRGIRTDSYAYWKRNEGMGEPALFDVQLDPQQRNNIFPQMKNSDVVKKLDEQLVRFFSRYSEPEYDLWKGEVARGTTPNPLPWLKQNPLPWIKKYWNDFLATQ